MRSQGVAEGDEERLMRGVIPGPWHPDLSQMWMLTLTEPRSLVGMVFLVGSFFLQYFDYIIPLSPGLQDFSREIIIYRLNGGLLV